MTDITFTVEGARHAEMSLLSFAEEFGPRNARTALAFALRKAITPITQEIRALTPVDTGGLRDSIFQATRTPNRFELTNSRFFTRGTVLTAEAGYRWTREQQAIRYAALATQYGTVDQAPRPVLGPILARRAESLANDVIDAIEARIENRAAEFNKQRNRMQFTRR